MAIHAHSTTVSGRRLLPLGASAPGPLIQPTTRAAVAHLGTSGQRVHLKPECEADLLAILDAGPISPAEMQFMSRQRRQRALLSIDALERFAR